VGNLAKAKDCLLQSLIIDPQNPYALKNLGAIYGKEGDDQKAVEYLTSSFEINPEDPQVAFGIGLAYKRMGDLKNASTYFDEVLALKAPDTLVNMAKEALTEIAAEGLKSTGYRMDAVFYLTHALEIFQDKSLEDIKYISFEIALKGQSGLDINDPSTKYQLSSLEGEFTGLHLVCIMYAGFKKFAPDTDAGIDLSEEFEMAQKMFNPVDST
jgi:tetratricopeptide (TPR) repeat protein